MNTELIKMLEEMAAKTTDPAVTLKLGELIGYLKYGKNNEYVPYPIYPYPSYPFWYVESPPRVTYTTGTPYVTSGSTTYTTGTALL